jgi:hypothetical protein
MPWPTSYKDDQGNVGDNYLDWTYYILTAGQATLTGWGDYEGSLLNLTHAPGNLYYAYQVGIGANNRNLEYGHGGWFFANGTIAYEGENTQVSLSGDFGFDADCCPQWSVTRTWTATDCAGNTTSWSQTIDFQSGDDIPEPPVAAPCLGDTNNDGQRNTNDILTILGYYGYVGQINPGDLNGDGLCNTNDILIILTVFGMPCE